MSGRILACQIQDKLTKEVPFNIAITILFIWLASFFDYYLTVYQIGIGAIEINPILAPFFNAHHYIEALIVKMVLTFPGVCILSIFYQKRVVSRALPLVVLVYVCLLAYHAINLAC